MTVDKNALFNSARAAREKSYCPYSKKSVGAALLASSGRIYEGANIENSSFGATVCAERSALISALMAGERKFLAIAIEGGEKDTPPDSLFTPCGICRQTLSEFCDGDFEIFILGKDGKTKSFTLGELLPEAFSLNAEDEE
jgi:cytidine deaminase